MTFQSYRISLKSIYTILYIHIYTLYHYIYNISPSFNIKVCQTKNDTSHFQRIPDSISQLANRPNPSGNEKTTAGCLPAWKPSHSSRLQPCNLSWYNYCSFVKKMEEGNLPQTDLWGCKSNLKYLQKTQHFFRFFLGFIKGGAIAGKRTSVTLAFTTSHLWWHEVWTSSIRLQLENQIGWWLSPSCGQDDSFSPVFTHLKPLWGPLVFFLFIRWTNGSRPKRGGHGTATWHPFGTLSKPTPLWSESFGLFFRTAHWNLKEKNCCCKSRLWNLLVPASKWPFDSLNGGHVFSPEKVTYGPNEVTTWRQHFPNNLSKNSVKLGSTDEQIDWIYPPPSNSGKWRFIGIPS